MILKNIGGHLWQKLSTNQYIIQVNLIVYVISIIYWLKIR